MCECEKSIALRFLPHQVKFSNEFINNTRHAINGFASNICMECRGEKEEAYPKAAIFGLKGKIERYYWREIFKTYCLFIEEWLNENPFPIKDIIDFEKQFPYESKEFKKRAKKLWQENHRTNPKYDTTEISGKKFLDKVPIPIINIFAPYTQINKNGNKIGKWISQKGQWVGAEKIAAEHYESLKYTVLLCERRLISCWVATFLCRPIQSLDDRNSRIVMRHSTVGWSPQNPNTPLISFRLPEDFGSNHYYLRRKEDIDDYIKRLRTNNNLKTLFDELQNDGGLLRDYLWANDQKSIDLAKTALKLIPSDDVINCIEWAIKDFWNRQPGWPDLFIFSGKEFKFVEVKSPHDELSLEQMNWFQWAMRETNIPCEICRVNKENIGSLATSLESI